MNASNAVVPPLQIMQAAEAHMLTMQPMPSDVPVSVKGAPNKGFNTAAEFVWLVHGKPTNTAAFLAATAPAIGAYLVMRGARSFGIKSDNVEINIEGLADFDKAVALFRGNEVPGVSLKICTAI